VLGRAFSVWFLGVIRGYVRSLGMWLYEWNAEGDNSVLDLKD